MDSRYIEMRRGIAGERAYLRDSRISVDAVVASYWTVLDSMVIRELLTNWYPHLSEAKIRAALDYYRDHPDEIEIWLSKERADRECERAEA